MEFSDSIQPVCLPDVDSEFQLLEGMKLTAAGWGHNGTGKYLRVPLLPSIEDNFFFLIQNSCTNS